MRTLASQDLAFLEGMRDVVQIATLEAASVDRAARFPKEAIAALRSAKALSAYVPPYLGGGGVL